MIPCLLGTHGNSLRPCHWLELDDGLVFQQISRGVVSQDTGSDVAQIAKSCVI